MILTASMLLTQQECARLMAAFDVHLAGTTEVDFSGQPIFRLQDFAADCRELVSRCRYSARAAGYRVSLVDRVGAGVPQYVETTILTRMGPGGYHESHADNCRRDEAGNWVPNHTPDRTYTSILYLSEGFAGGDLCFPNYGVRVRPKPGMLVVFPADGDHEHSVAQVREGFRYSMVMWLTDKPEREEKFVA